MSSRTREINKITMAIIRISVKLMLLALLILLLYEAVIRGYAFGHAVFYAEAVEAAPGHDITVVVKDGEDVSQAADELEKKGLIKNIYAFLFQSRFYDYDKIYPGTYTFNTSMTSKEILTKLEAKSRKMKRTKNPGINQGAQKQHKRAQIRVLKNQKVISKNVSQTFRQKKQMQQILQRAPFHREKPGRCAFLFW
mgnify:CR=1 FL=1